MKKTIAILFTLTLAAFAASPDRFAPANGSHVKVAGTSTLHHLPMEGNTIIGQINAANGAASVIVSIPVTSIKSEHSKMDKLMAEALKAKQFPEIRYELTQPMPSSASASFSVKAHGKLTIAGVTRDAIIDVQATRNADGKYTFIGTAPLKMTSFGIKPPTAMLGTIKTGDDVKVTFRWVVEKAN
jgi:polyisoprenoid-binding protein YceI